MTTDNRQDNPIDVDQLRLELDVRRALLEDAPTPDVHEAFRDFVEKHVRPADTRAMEHGLAVDAADMLHGSTGDTPDKQQAPATIRPLRRPKATTVALAITAIAACLLALFLLTSSHRPATEAPATEGTLVYSAQHQPDEISLVDGGETVSLTSPTARSQGFTISDDDEIHITPSTPVADDDISTLVIPQGRVVRLVLDDSTRVWLSTDSRLIFPRHFNKKGTREVALEGEAYFEVARDESRPFVVNCGDLRTLVLGTRFCIRSFSGEVSRVTLLSGSVEVSCDQGSVRLKPNQDAAFEDDRLSVGNADLDVATAWMNGEFYFDGQTMREIMVEIGRWYRKDVVFTATDHLDEQLHFSAPRDLDLGDLIERLDMISGAKIRLEGDVLKVY